MTLRSATLAAVLVGLLALFACRGTTGVSNPCDLLSAGDLSKLAMSVGVGTPSSGDGFRECTWPIGDADPDPGQLKLVELDAAHFADYSAELVGAEQLAGIGTQALWHPIGVVVATDGSSTIRAQLYGVLDEELYKQTLSQLVASALTRATATDLPR